jgi:hypothetical protein
LLEADELSLLVPPAECRLAAEAESGIEPL